MLQSMMKHLNISSVDIDDLSVKNEQTVVAMATNLTTPPTPSPSTSSTSGQSNLHGLSWYVSVCFLMDVP